MKNLLLLIGLLCATLLSAQPKVSLEFVAGGFDSPLEIVHGGDSRLFVCERAGLIKIIDSNENVLAVPFLDLTDSVKSCGGNCEVGLMGMAFDPDYKNNGYFYLTYTSRLDWGASPWDATMRVSRFKVDALHPNLADKASETIVMEVYEPFINHNGGSIRFGHDGYLYIGWGDGGFEDINNPDPYRNAQNPKKLLGKILRIDVSQLPYTIPPDNPFVGDTTVLDEIWALGIRNPWKFNFDSETGDFWLADVQHATQEEIDFHQYGEPGGQNYGWKCYEGINPFDTTGCMESVGELTFPVHTYDHFSDSCFSVSGGVVYRGESASDLVGYYVYGDFCREFIGGVKSDGQGGWISDTLGYTPNVYISAIGEGYDKTLYVVDFGYGNPGTGKIHRIVTGCTGFSVQDTVLMPIQCAGDCNGQIEIIPISPNGSDFSYSWDGQASTGATLLVDGLCSGSHFWMVTDSAGCTMSQTINLAPLHSSPLPSVQISGNELSTVDTFALYQWLLGDTTISGATNATYQPVVTGFYSVIVTNEFGCTGTSDSVFFEVVATDDGIFQDATVTLGPNPTMGELKVEITNTRPTPIVLSVVNALGQVLQTYTQPKNQPHWKRNIQLSTLSGNIIWIDIQRGKEHVLRAIRVE